MSYCQKIAKFIQIPITKLAHSSTWCDEWRDFRRAIWCVPSVMTWSSCSFQAEMFHHELCSCSCPILLSEKSLGNQPSRWCKVNPSGAGSKEGDCDCLPKNLLVDKVHWYICGFKSKKWRMQFKNACKNICDKFWHFWLEIQKEWQLRKCRRQSLYLYILSRKKTCFPVHLMLRKMCDVSWWPGKRAVLPADRSTQ